MDRELEIGLDGIGLVNRGLVLLRLYEHDLGDLESYQEWDFQVERWREGLLQPQPLPQWKIDLNENLLWIADKLSNL